MAIQGIRSEHSHGMGEGMAAPQRPTAPVASSSPSAPAIEPTHLHRILVCGVGDAASGVVQTATQPRAPSPGRGARPGG